MNLGRESGKVLLEEGNAYTELHASKHDTFTERSIVQFV